MDQPTQPLGELLKQYEEAHLQEKEAKKIKDDLKNIIRDALVEAGADETPPINEGKIVLSSRQSFTYSEEVQQMEEDLKARKAEEEQTGVAVDNPTIYVSWTKIK